MSERRVGRRLFLGGLGAAGVGLTATACQERGTGGVHVDGREPVSLPDPVVRTQPPTTLRFLSDEQARTVEAMAARIIPGTPEEPGAREAGTVFYVDQLLASHSGWPDPAYMEGPFAQTYTDDEPPDEDDDSVVWVHEEELERYGRQGPFVPQEMYPMGIPRLDELARARHDDDFVDLAEEDQDALLMAVEDGEDEDVEEIFDELCRGEIRTESKQDYLEIIASLANRGVQGVILGCTEIGLLIQQPDTEVRLYDTTEIHAEQVVQKVIVLADVVEHAGNLLLFSFVFIFVGYNGHYKT